MSYRAPIKDMLFDIEHLARIDQVAQLPGFEEAGLETAQAVLSAVAGIVKYEGLQGKTVVNRKGETVEIGRAHV